jgi:hypothetical protein
MTNLTLHHVKSISVDKLGNYMTLMVVSKERSDKFEIDNPEQKMGITLFFDKDIEIKFVKNE